ncbi:hypothetical protein F7725_021963 [Dissostichus mawsoni]|uniref:DnaJ homolog subfamily B member 9 n=1 Tax=Dissostichus mawsoni TaxID=36200 RepID=A0A7J5ZCM1_DISMA|nr:hypothetical protein F7725_021963 [Dissostichus mawsoni]
MALRVVVLRLWNEARQQPLAFVAHQLELSAAYRSILRLFVTSSPVCEMWLTELSNCSSQKGARSSSMATAQCVLLLAVHILLISEFILANGDYYEILGVPKEATERQIKKAFHKLALKYHPDRNRGPNAEAKFREIAEAYETLSDDKRRREYDQFGHGPSTGGGHQGGGGAYNFNQHYQSFNFDDISKTLTLLVSDTNTTSTPKTKPTKRDTLTATSRPTGRLPADRRHRGASGGTL